MNLNAEIAFLEDFAAQGFGLPIAYENAHFEPVTGQPYVALRHSAGALSAYTIAGHDTQSGVFQFVLHYPAGGGLLPGKQKASEIFAAYPVARKLTNGGVIAHITGHQLAGVEPADGWFELFGQIDYRAYPAR